MFCVCVFEEHQRLPAFYLLAFGSSRIVLWTLSTTQWHCAAKDLKKKKKKKKKEWEMMKRYMNGKISFPLIELEKLALPMQEYGQVVAITMTVVLIFCFFLLLFLLVI